MLDNKTVRLMPAVLAGAAIVVAMSGCAGYATPYGDTKVTVCHKDKKTLVLPESAVAAHLGHGDTRGPCE